MPEYDEQVALMAMVRLWEGRVPELALLFHVPNGGARDYTVGAKLKAAGVRAGVPDLILPVARQGYHGLAIELKRIKGGYLEPTQHWWHEQLRAQGWQVEVCKGHRAAWRLLQDYLGTEMPLMLGV
jgi:hypothetical protein